jgi:uncharacterized protein
MIPIHPNSDLPGWRSATCSLMSVSSVTFCMREAEVSYNALIMIAKDLLEILVCPACKQPLEHREKPESLKCRQCHRVYPVKDDIPIMLVDEATVEEP